MRSTVILLTILAIPSFADDAKPMPKLADAAWLAGGWKSDPAEKMAMEELWQAPANGSMCGTFRMSSAGRPALYEFLLLEEQADGVWMRIRHYGPEMADKDEKPVRLKMAEASDRRLLFTNPDNGNPKRVVYERDGKEGLVVVVETERESKPAQLKLKFTRAASK
jgi:Domain of unknown function (DUF6265)